MPILPSPGGTREESLTERLDRRLVAVMFTDMVGYTALMQADERRLAFHPGRPRWQSTDLP